MSKKKIDLKEIITPIDIIPVFVIAIGLLIAIFFQEIAIRLIGVSVSVLGAVALFMLISQRISDTVKPHFPKSSANHGLEVTTTKDHAGTRQTVENFGDSFGEDDEFPISETSKSQFNNNEEDIRTIGTFRNDAKVEGDRHVTTKTPPAAFNDSFSGMRIVGKTKKNHTSKTIETDETNASYRTTENNIEKILITESTSSDEGVIGNISEDVSKQSEGIGVAKSPDETSIPPYETPQQSIEEALHINFETKLTTEPSPKQAFREKEVNLPLSIFTETDQLLGEEPRKEFEYFLSRILIIIRSITDSRTALFLLADFERNEFIVESFVTVKPELIIKKKRIPVANDIPSQIFNNAKPEILTDINPSAELDLIPYYSEYSGASSFVGVPVFWGENPIGVVCADSTTNDAYSSATVAFLGHFTKLISALVKSYTQKYDLLQDSKTLEAVNLFNYIATNSKYGTENLADTIVNSIARLFDVSTVGVVGYNSEKQIWELKAVKSSFNYTPGQEITYDGSIVGNTINTCKSKKFFAKDISKIRHTKYEPKLESGEFISIPLRSATGVYGALFIENISSNLLSDYDQTVLEIIGIHAGNAIERMHLLENLHRSQLLDQETGLLNPAAFYARISEEIDRCSDANQYLTLCIFRIDKYAALDPVEHSDRYEFARITVIEKIKKYLKSYDKFGIINDDTFGILFIAKESSQTKLVAERIRSEVANTVLNIDGSKFSVTLSIGIAGMTLSDHDTDSLINNAASALNKALEQTNKVHLFY